MESSCLGFESSSIYSFKSRISLKKGEKINQPRNFKRKDLLKIFRAVSFRSHDFKRILNKFLVFKKDVFLW